MAFTSVGLIRPGPQLASYLVKQTTKPNKEQHANDDQQRIQLEGEPGKFLPAIPR